MFKISNREKNKIADSVYLIAIQLPNSENTHTL